MVDFSMYRKLHLPPNKLWRIDQTEDSDLPSATELLQSPSIPQGDVINVFPTTIVGFNMRLKKWGKPFHIPLLPRGSVALLTFVVEDIEVDGIQEVEWNKKAFDSLVIDEDTKRLLKALVTNQIKPEKSTDLIQGKGNGLILLLHG
jgi:hypothetical protein